MQSAFLPADILLPVSSVDMNSWSVIACDQYTSEPEYWEEAERIVGNAPSALSMIFPEVYLDDEDREERLSDIQHTMEDYLRTGIFREYKQSMIYVRRTDNNGKLREGLVGKIDLEEYEYQRGSLPQVRATEATVPGRLPPRIRIRENALLELPHVIMLIDDIRHRVIEPLANMISSMEKVYDFDLMLGGGHITGYLVDKDHQGRILSELERLGDPAYYEDRYHLGSEPPMIYAVGDGNHSLASAKALYEKLKMSDPGRDWTNHPARYALVEIENLHNPGLVFEPIYRIVKDVDPGHLVDKMVEEADFSGKDEGATFEVVYSPRPGESLKSKRFVIAKHIAELPVGTIQRFLDKYTEKYGGKIDYIHGKDALLSLTKRNGAVGFLLPSMDKEELFPAVMANGALPRKTFSMGHARDKRYYTECRKIVP